MVGTRGPAIWVNGRSTRLNGRPAVPSHRFLPQPFGPARKPLRRPDVVEKLHGCEGFKVSFGKSARQFRSRRLGSEGDALLLPLEVLRGFTGYELPEEVVHDAGCHGFHQARGLRRTTTRVLGIPRGSASCRQLCLGQTP